MSQDRGTPWWISIPLVLIFLGGLAFAIYRYSQHEDPPADPPPVEDASEKGKGKGKMPGPPPIPPPPKQPPKT